ncbi:MAG: hypothetical protein ABIL09_27035 [Gemmatimonadota bacterium]
MWAGLIAGAAAGLAIGLPGWGVLWWALQRRPQVAVKVALGAIPARLLAAGGVTYGVLTWLPVSPGGYVAGLAATYLGVLVLEVAWWHRRARSAAR